MSLRVEWFHTSSANLTVALSGTQIGDFPVTEQVAIVLDGDECAVLEGPARDVRRKLANALTALDLHFPEVAL